jgi:hypothetical protein
MASAIIHLCIAKEVNKYLKMNEYDLLLGSIAPDISKQIGETKEISHFLDHSNEDDIPNIDRFLAKYRNDLHNPFTMGYFIHLLTDKYWFRDYVYQFIERFTRENVKKKITYTAIRDLIYNDYTNLNTDLIDKYMLPLDIFSEEFREPKTAIREIPVDKLDILLDQMGLIIEEAKKDKNFVFDINDIEVFIENSIKYIIKDIQILGIKD